MDEAAEARVIPLGEPLDGGGTLFEGSFASARQFVLDQPAELRAELTVWTQDRVFSGDEIASFE